MVDYEVVERGGDYVVVRLRGRMIGETTSQRLHIALADHYVDDGVRRIRVDLDELDFIDLEGVGALLDLWREARRLGKRLIAEGATGQVKEKLLTTGVHRLLRTGEP